MLEIPFGDPENESGVWKGGKRGDGQRTAILSCPMCRQPAPLSDHTIEPDGMVSPSVVCPFQGCSFHEHLKLIGWIPYAL